MPLAPSFTIEYYFCLQYLHRYDLSKCLGFFPPGQLLTLSLHIPTANTLKTQGHALLQINSLSMSIKFVSADFKYSVLCMWSGGNPILKLLWLMWTVHYNCQLIYSQLMYKSWKQKGGESCPEWRSLKSFTQEDWKLSLQNTSSELILWSDFTISSNSLKNTTLDKSFSNYIRWLAESSGRGHV